MTYLSLYRLLVVSLTLLSCQLLADETPASSIPVIDWDVNLKKFQFDHDRFLGQRFSVECKAAQAQLEFDPIYGTDSYPSDNAICVAALHAGEIDRQGGIVTVQLNPGLESYQGSDQHGVTSQDLPATHRSLIFINEMVSVEDEHIHLKYVPVLEWDTKFTATGFARKQFAGQHFTFSCPAAPADMRPRLVYGTDTYAFQSIVCLAALHAGVITREGGLATLEIKTAIPKLVGSLRNGIETKSSGGGHHNISFIK
ncbi:LCCL domain-containing protein [Marinicella sp. W31]|uniref:LCCL domain-containing protein n=1 Tax=Marinicella sp. W31 TaxID=3023713 RepID=UPI0037581043